MDVLHGHFKGLYDQNETATGELRDLSTGEIIDNSSADPGAPELQVVKGNKSKRSTDALPPLPKENDAAARWLAQHNN